MDTLITAPAVGTGSGVGTSPAASAASWGAIIAGAAVAIAISLILFALGSGLGFASMSPWSGHGIGAGTFTVAAAVWLIVMQWISAIFGGYITGRLRTRWIGTHVHEIFFRDTANGLVMWAVSTVIVATLIASTVAAGISGGAKAASDVISVGAQGAAAGIQGAAQSGSGTTAASSADASSADAASAMAYGVDKLFRSGTPGAAGPGAGALGGRDPRVEAGRILVNDLAAGSVPDADRAYLAALVAAQTGLTEADAQKRVDELIAAAADTAQKVKAAADAARKDAAEVSIYTALSLLIGAFIASVSAALGGRLRDEHV